MVVGVGILDDPSSFPHRLSIYLWKILNVGATLAVARNPTDLSRTIQPVRVRYAWGDRKGRPYD